LKDGTIYEGEWLNNLRHGKGVLYHPSGTKIEGYWEADRQCGASMITKLSGKTYNTLFINDMKVDAVEKKHNSFDKFYWNLLWTLLFKGSLFLLYFDRSKAMISLVILNCSFFYLVMLFEVVKSNTFKLLRNQKSVAEVESNIEDLSRYRP
jgi:hypothetical protein